jgi:hypothetical protein
MRLPGEHEDSAKHQQAVNSAMSLLLANVQSLVF